MTGADLIVVLAAAGAAGGLLAWLRGSRARFLADPHERDGETWWEGS